MRSVTYGPGPTQTGPGNVTFGPGPMSRDLLRKNSMVDQLQRLGLGAGDLPSPALPIIGSVGMSLVGLGGSAVYGGAIGAVASHSWKGAATGALAGATAAAGTSAIYSGLAKMWVQTAVFGAVAVGAGVLTYHRWKRTPKRR